MKKIIPLLLLLSLFAGCGAPAETASNYQQISMEEAVSMMEKENDYILLDVRTVEEFEEKHIPGAINDWTGETVSGLS